MSRKSRLCTHRYPHLGICTHRCIRCAVSRVIKLWFSLHMLQDNIFFPPGKCSRQMALHKVDNLPLQLTLASLTNGQALAGPSSCSGSLYQPAPQSDLYQTSGLKTSSNHACFLSSLTLTPAGGEVQPLIEVTCNHIAVNVTWWQITWTDYATSQASVAR